MRDPQRPSDPPVIAALKELREAQPDLAPAADLQIELAQITRRVGARAPLPALAAVTARQERLAGGRQVLAFADFRFEWSDVRLALREVARAMEAAGAISSDDAATIASLVRGETAAVEKALSKWFEGDRGLDDNMRGELLMLPAQSYISEQLLVADPLAIHREREGLKGWLGRELEADLVAMHERASAAARRTWPPRGSRTNSGPRRRTSRLCGRRPGSHWQPRWCSACTS